MPPKGSKPVCRTCQQWARDEKGLVKTCTHYAVAQGDRGSEAMGVVAIDGIKTGPYFGCVHHQSTE